MTLIAILLIIALCVLLWDAMARRSLQSAGLAFIAAAMLVPMV